MKTQIINDSAFRNPEYAINGDAGMDIRVDFTDPSKIKGEKFYYYYDEIKNKITLYSDSRVILPTGLRIKPPKGYFIMAVPKSGQSFKKGFTIANSPGTIDHPYTGEMGVIIQNNTNGPIEISHGEKVCQIILMKHETIEFEDVEEFEQTERGEKGFGSTGII